MNGKYQVPVSETEVQGLNESNGRIYHKSSITEAEISDLRKMIDNQDLEAVKALLNREPGLIERLDEQHVPMSFHAAARGNLALVRYIVEYSRASMNAVDKKNRNILHYASESGDLELSRYLVEKVGMSPVAGDADLITPLDIAVHRGHSVLKAYYEEVCGAAYEQMYRNPIRTGMFPDPSILRVGEDYYMVNSSFIFFPCIPISHSRDLIHWRIIGHAISNPEWAGLDGLEGGRGYWAPDISFHDGRFYVTATYRLNDTGSVYRRQIIVSSDQAEGPYSKPVFIEEDGIDPSLFTDDDGRRYMLLNRGARILELDDKAEKQISEGRLLYYGSQKRAPEGPHLLKKDGWYYLFLAEGGTGPGHRITVARSRELMGNYQPCPYNPIMIQRDSYGAIQRCGHGKPVMTQLGQWYMVYLCGRKVGNGYTVLGRETALDPITWTQDGWPMVNNLQGPSALQIRPELPYEAAGQDEPTGFGTQALSLAWMFPRSPDTDAYEMQDGLLWLKGSKEPLSSVAARNILLRRQEHFDFQADVRMGLVDLESGQESGMVGYYDEHSWLTFSVSADGDKKLVIKVSEHMGDVTREYISGSEDPGMKVNDRIHLRMVCEGLRRNCQYSFDGIHYETCKILEEVTYLSDEGLKVGKRFTGAMIGVYAYGNGEDLFVPFGHFRYRELRK